MVGKLYKIFPRISPCHITAKPFLTLVLLVLVLVVILQKLHQSWNCCCSKYINIAMTISIYNIQNNSTVHTPLLIVHGESSSSKSGIITVSHKGNAFPSLFYEVNQGFFKAIIHLEPGENPLLLTQTDGTIQNDGSPSFGKKTHSTLSLNVNYTPLIQNRPIHLCLLIAKDSPALFDTTSQKQRQEGNGLDLAIRKLRIGGRLMQAYTNEQMLRAGFGNRTFNFVEEYTKDTQFYQEFSQGGNFRNTIKIHVLRSQKTLRELRDPNLAQQNSKGTNTGGLFGIAMDALRDYGGPFVESNKPVQAAVLFLDAHWDPKLKLILTHAALGGGDDRIKLAIFGSHGIYSWPQHLEQIVPAFQDTSRSNINEVANDCNQCGTYWECLNITLGAFMHEIGHLLGCPHQTYGIMLRDYVTFNRSFTSKEVFCLRTGSNGLVPILPKDECKWHRLDLLRFLYHPSFTLPSDYLDESFQKQFGHWPKSGKPSLLPVGNGSALLKSLTGIYAIEIYKGDLAHGFIEYLPVSINHGTGPQREVLVNGDELRSLLPRDKQDGDFDVHVLSIDGQQAEFKDFIKSLTDDKNFIKSDFGLGRGLIVGIKSGIFGNSQRGAQQPLAVFDPNRVVNVRVYWGGALDGIRIDLGPSSKIGNHGTPPPIPERNYDSRGFQSLLKKVKDLSVQNTSVSTPRASSQSVLFGKQTNNYSDFPLLQGETISHFSIRSGQWVDAIRIHTSTGRSSELFGKSDGGGEGLLSVPDGYGIVGFFGSVGNWIDSIGVVYIPK